MMFRHRLLLSSVVVFVGILFILFPVSVLALTSLIGEPVNILNYLWRADAGNLVHDLIEKISLQYFSLFFIKSRYFRGFLNSLAISTQVVIATSLIGLVIGFALRLTSMPFKRWFRAVIALPFVMPTFIHVLALMLLLGRSGLVSHAWQSVGLSGVPVNIYSPLGVVIVHTVTFFPITTLAAVAAFERLDTSLVENSLLLGSPPFYTFWKVALPLVAPGIAAGSVLVFIVSFCDFAAPMLLLPPGHNALVVEAFRELIGPFPHYGEAGMLGVIMIGTVLVAIAVQRSFTRRLSMVSSGPFHLPTIGGRMFGWAMLILCGFIILWPFLHLASIIMMSLAGQWQTEFLPSAYTFQHFAYVLGQAPQPIINSFILCGISLSLLVTWSVTIAYFAQRVKASWGKGAVDLATVLPLAVPGTIMGIAYIWAFNVRPLAIHMTPAIIVIAYAIVKSQYCIRTTTAAWQQFDSRLEEASLTLGASRLFSAWKVVLPAIMPGILAGATMAYISCMHDISLTILLSHPQWDPLSLRIYREIEAGRMSRSCAYCVVLLLATMIPYWLVSWLQRRRQGRALDMTLLDV